MYVNPAAVPAPVARVYACCSLSSVWLQAHRNTSNMHYYCTKIMIYLFRDFLIDCVGAMFSSISRKCNNTRPSDKAMAMHFVKPTDAELEDE